MRPNGQEALTETRYCDCGHPAIRRLANELAQGCGDRREVVVWLFYHVREQVPFGFDLYCRKASEVLEQGYGVCWNKALLLTALLRSLEIPAHFGSVPVRREFIAPVAGDLHQTLNEPFYHCLVKVQIEGQWIVLDPVLDQRTYDTFFEPLGVPWGIDWNGVEDCRLYTESVLGPPVMHADIDAAIESNCGNMEMDEQQALMMYSQLNERIWHMAGIRLGEMRQVT